MHFLYWEIFHIYVAMHLQNVHVCARDNYVRFCLLRREQILFRPYPDNENCDDSDDMM